MRLAALTQRVHYIGKAFRVALGRTAFRHVLQTVAVTSLLSPITAFAAGAVADTVPANASKDAYGNEWKCDAGFRQKGEVCDELSIPTNAFPTNRTYGAGWECERGYREIDRERCEKIHVPENAYLAAHGDRWNCLRGFVKLQDKCVTINVPVNGYLSDEVKRRGWECDRGFEVVGNDCIRIAVPENAYLTNRNYGATWLCERGYRRQVDACIAVPVPENAFFTGNSLSLGWQCDRGFQRSGQTCVPVTVPQNAHLNRVGNAWECDKSFSPKAGTCVRDQ